jgi:uncharacterized protein (DUF1697 family)
MPRSVLLLRGVNVGTANRVPMPALRQRLADAGCEDVRTHLQSGNVIVDGDGARAAALLRRILRDEFDADVPVLARTRDELAAVITADPLGHVAAEPRLYQVTFLSEPLKPEALTSIAARAVGEEQVVALGRELYGWHPGGIHNSKLATAMGARSVLGGRTATARNWTTVTKLLEICDA